MRGDFAIFDVGERHLTFHSDHEAGGVDSKLFGVSVQNALWRFDVVSLFFGNPISQTEHGSGG